MSLLRPSSVTPYLDGYLAGLAAEDGVEAEEVCPIGEFEDRADRDLWCDGFEMARTSRLINRCFMYE